MENVTGHFNITIGWNLHYIYDKWRVLAQICIYNTAIPSLVLNIYHLVQFQYMNQLCQINDALSFLCVSQFLQAM